MNRERTPVTTAQDGVPGDLKYTADHEWAVVTATGTVRVGITFHAQDALGDIVFVQLPELGTAVQAGTALGEVESTKSVSDLLAPVSGTVAVRNETLDDTPELVNSDPYGAGWMLEITPDDPGAVEGLLDAEAYRGLTST
jgi:glycine cleavage system H protein